MPDYEITFQQPTVYRLHIADGLTVNFDSTHHYPNWLHRYMTTFLLGWRYERLDPPTTEEITP